MLSFSNLLPGQDTRIVNEYVPNEEIGIYFAASALVVHPYISASGSGICHIAYGFDRPVIATNVGSLPEVVSFGSVRSRGQIVYG